MACGSRPWIKSALHAAMSQAIVAMGKDAQLKELACRENRVGVYNGRPLFEPGPSPREEFAQARRGYDAQALHSVRRNYSHGTAAFNKVRAPQFDLFTRYGLHFCSNFACVSASRHRFAVVGYRFDDRKTHR